MVVAAEIAIISRNGIRNSTQELGLPRASSATIITATGRKTMVAMRDFARIMILELMGRDIVYSSPEPSVTKRADAENRVKMLPKAIAEMIVVALNEWPNTLSPTMRVSSKGSAKMNAVDGSILDRKSTRLNSSHDQISYAVFCL